MSTELERRIKTIESKVITGTPCRHALPLVYSDEEADAMLELLDACPRCRTASGFRPRVVVITYPEHPRAPILSMGVEP